MAEPSQSQTTGTAARRRSSGLMPGFDSLQQHKRGNDVDAARRQSMSDQHAKGGIFHQLFHNNVGRNAK
ncbi:hypothetical protein CDD83_8184 [Cordyceps sp. RAO-2017]|nr:hypothetical protein CDD83_8184 [Cordyceps sp. RAO-2017]